MLCPCLAELGDDLVKCAIAQMVRSRRLKRISVVVLELFGKDLCGTT